MISSAWAKLDWHRGLSWVLLYALFRGLMLAFVVPPWQGPDEPGHAEYALRLAEDLSVPREPEAALQARILADMARERWYGRLRTAAPSQPHSSFFEVPRLADAPTQIGGESPLGYLPQATAARLLGRRAGAEPDIGRALLAMRMANVLVTLLALVLAAWALNALLAPAMGLPLLTLIAAMPMLGFAGAMAGNDIAAVALAMAWWGLLWRVQSRDMLHSGDTRPSGRRLARPVGFALLAGLALLTGLAKRSGLYLWPLTLMVGLSWWLAARRRARSASRADGEALRAEERAVGARARWMGLAAAALLLALLAWPISAQPAGWSRTGSDWAGIRSADAARSGDWGFRIVDADVASWQYIEQSLVVQGGERALARAWLRAEPSGAGDVPTEGFGQAQLVLNDDQGNWWGETIALGTGWQELQVEARLPAEASRIRLALVPGDGDAAGMARFQADEVSLRLGGEERLRNGGAERPYRLGTWTWHATIEYLALSRLAGALPESAAEIWTGLSQGLRGTAFLFRSAWGGFGWLALWPGWIGYGIAAVLSVLMVVALGLAVIRPGMLRPEEGAERVDDRAHAMRPFQKRMGADGGGGARMGKVDLRWCGIGALFALGIAVVGPMAGAGADRLPQGRYLLPALLPLWLPALLMVERLWPGRGPRVLALLVLALDLVLLFGLVWPGFLGAA